MVFLSLRRVLAVAVAAFLSIACPGAGDEPAPPAAGPAEEMGIERLAMVEDIRAHAATVGPVGGRGALDEGVLAAMAAIPRHRFVPEDLADQAYEDRPLPIGFGQTISQPYIVALMTDLLDLSGEERVLEVGTGSGYHAAVISRMAKAVYSIEIVPDLAKAAAGRLAALGFATVTVRQGDGYHGWVEHAPFDAIVVTAAAGHVPPPLVAQLKPGGRMIIPVGPPFLVQELVLVTKDGAGEVSTRSLLPVRFVPLTGGR